MLAKKKAVYIYGQVFGQRYKHAVQSLSDMFLESMSLRPGKKSAKRLSHVKYLSVCLSVYLSIYQSIDQQIHLCTVIIKQIFMEPELGQDFSRIDMHLHPLFVYYNLLKLE